MWLISKIYDFEGVGFFTALKRDDDNCIVAQITRRCKIVLLENLYFDLYTPEGKVKKHVSYLDLFDYDLFGVFEDENYITYYVISQLGYQLSQLLEYTGKKEQAIQNQVKFRPTNVLGFTYPFISFPQNVTQNGAFLKFVGQDLNGDAVEFPFVGEYIVQLLHKLGSNLSGLYIKIENDTLIIPLHSYSENTMIRNRLAYYKITDVKKFNVLLAKGKISNVMVR